MITTPAPGAEERNGERAEEFERNGQTEANTLNGGVQAEVHRRKNQSQQQDWPPLMAREIAQARPDGR
jgi:hypothetical protein